MGSEMCIRDSSIPGEYYNPAYENAFKYKRFLLFCCTMLIKPPQLPIVLSFASLVGSNPQIRESNSEKAHLNRETLSHPGRSAERKQQRTRGPAQASTSGSSEADITLDDSILILTRAPMPPQKRNVCAYCLVTIISRRTRVVSGLVYSCLLYTSDAADE